MSLPLPRSGSLQRFLSKDSHHLATQPALIASGEATVCPLLMLYVHVHISHGSAWPTHSNLQLNQHYWNQVCRFGCMEANAFSKSATGVWDGNGCLRGEEERIRCCERDGSLPFCRFGEICWICFLLL
jgi:hypothetical protein